MLSTLKRGKALGAQAREVIYNVYIYFAKRKEEQLRQGDEEARGINVTHKTSFATRVSVTSVKAVKRDIEENGCHSPDCKQPNRKRSQYFDDFEECALRRMIHAMYLDGKRLLWTQRQQQYMKTWGRPFPGQHSENSCCRWGSSSRQSTTESC